MEYILACLLGTGLIYAVCAAMVVAGKAYNKATGDDPEHHN